MFDRPSLLNLESAQEHASPGIKKKYMAWKEMTIHCIVDNTISFCNQRSTQRCRIAGCCPIPAQLWTQLDSYMLFFETGWI
jgi:hypothetical protein